MQPPSAEDLDIISAVIRLSTPYELIPTDQLALDEVLWLKVGKEMGLPHEACKSRFRKLFMMSQQASSQQIPENGQQPLSETSSSDLGRILCGQSSVPSNPFIEGPSEAPAKLGKRQPGEREHPLQNYAQTKMSKQSAVTGTRARQVMPMPDTMIVKAAQSDLSNTFVNPPLLAATTPAREALPFTPKATAIISIDSTPPASFMSAAVPPRLLSSNCSDQLQLGIETPLLDESPEHSSNEAPSFLAQRRPVSELPKKSSTPDRCSNFSSAVLGGNAPETTKSEGYLTRLYQYFTMT